MKALSYLLLITLKNRILSIRKKPAYLVLYGIIFVSIIFMFLSTIFTDTPDVPLNNFSDIRVLYMIILAINLLLMFSQVITGLSNGSTLFNMADVGLLFVSPISSKKILIYGLLKQMGTTIISAIFILYQIPTLRKSFGLTVMSVIFLLIIYIIILFFSQLLAIGTYIFSNGNTRRKQLVKIIIITVIACFILAVFYQYKVLGMSIMESILSLTTNTYIQYFPIIGWPVMFFEGIIIGSISKVILSSLLFFISSIGLVLFFTLREGDYYEDVLSSTELYYNRLQAAKEGKGMASSKIVKVKEEKMGLLKGNGASALFYRHILEKKRSSRFLYIDLYTILSALSAGVFCYYVDTEFSGYIVLGILIYMQFFLTMFGKFSYELGKPYIYLIPVKSIYKLIYATLFSFLKPFFDGIIIFTVVCIVSKTSIVLNVFLALGYIATCLVLICYTIICYRVFGGQPSKIISATLGVLIFILIFGPSIGLSIGAYFFLPASLKVLAIVPYIFVCLVISIFTFVVCGDIFDRCEYRGSM